MNSIIKKVRYDLKEISDENILTSSQRIFKKKAVNPDEQFASKTTLENLIHDIEIFEDYRKNENFINEYHNFISQVFPGINFKEWFIKGFWTKDYIPFSIMRSGKIISNISAALMEVIISGKVYNAVQLGAVATLPGYRGKGLSKLLMHYVMDIYKDNTDFIFLYANNSVMDFYPKYGFKNITEKIFVNNSNIPSSNYEARKLDLVNENDYKLLTELISGRTPLTKIFGAESCGWITMWHVYNIHTDNLYYLENEDVIIIKTEKDNTLHIWDVISRKPINLQKTLSKIVEPNATKIINFHFPPDQMEYGYNKTIEENTGLFTFGKVNLENEQIRFPETAKT